MTDKHKNRNTIQLADTQEKPPLSSEHKELLSWFGSVKFRKTVFGGVSETDVWKKLEELNALYEAALRAERIRYDTLLEEKSRHYEKMLQESTKLTQATWEHDIDKVLPEKKRKGVGWRWMDLRNLYLLHR